MNTTPSIDPLALEFGRLKFMRALALTAGDEDAAATITAQIDELRARETAHARRKARHDGGEPHDAA